MLVACSVSAQESMKDVADRVFAVARDQYEMMDTLVAPGRVAKTFENGRLVTSDIGWWCSGFPAGTYWYIYEYTRDPQMLELAKKHTAKLSTVLEKHGDHDLGFMVNNSYGQAFRLTGDSLYLPMVEAAAECLAERFNPACGVTRSWDWGKWDFPVIIDNMMNLELLENASKLSGRPEFDAIARTHANTTARNHFRDDYSCYHLVDYDPETGEVLGRQTVQGYADESCWSRGEAWALYGYTMMYRETGVPDYLTQAVNIAGLLEKILPQDGIPYWDFNAPGDAVMRDASAGAIMASALVDLSRLTGDKGASARYLSLAGRMLRTLASDEYLAKPGENGGFLLKHCVGNMPAGTEVDVPLTYADYYFLEALLKYTR